MKKYFFYFFIVFLGVIQSANSQDFRFGIKGGINKCGLLGPDVPSDFTSRYGYGVGFYFDSRIAEHMSTLFEVDYSRYRFGFSEQNIDSLNNKFQTIEERNDFLRIPVMLRYKRGYEFVFFYINAGLQFSLLLNNNRSSILYINDLPIDDEYYYKYKNNWYDYGLIGGAGFQFQAVNIDFKYYFSTRNMYKSVEAKEMRYNILSLEMAYQLNYRSSSPFGRKTGWKGLKYKIKHLFK